MIGLDMTHEYDFLDEEMARLLRRLKKQARATVIHQETCPCCGAKLVNIYRRGTAWKCRKCWEESDGNL